MKERNSGPIFGCLDSHVPELGDFDNEGLVLKRKPRPTYQSTHLDSHVPKSGDFVTCSFTAFTHPVRLLSFIA